MSDLYLVYVKPFCKNNDGSFEYLLFFSETPDVVWGVDWDSLIPNIQDDLTPEKTTYSKIFKIKTLLPLKTIEEISCFSMEYAINRVIALSWVDITNLDEYPESRLVLHFGDDFNKVAEILDALDIKMLDY